MSYPSRRRHALPRLGLGLLLALEPSLIQIASASPVEPSRPMPLAAVTEATRDEPGDAAPVGSPPLLQAAAGVTALSGRVLQTDGTPLRGVVLKLGQTRALTDAQGLFLLEDVPAGEMVLRIDGRSATAGQTAVVDHGIYEARVSTALGVTTQLSWTSWLPVIDHKHDVALQSPVETPVVATTPDVPGLELRIPRGVVLTDLDGETVDHVGITAIPINRTPFPLPRNVPVPVYFTAQPGGATISSADGSWLGVQVVYPNYKAQLPGARATFWRYRPDSLGWSPYGAGTVTANGRQVMPDAGTRLYALDGAMMNGAGFTPPTAGPVPNGGAAGGNPTGGDPVDLGSGLFVMSQTDLALSDVLPLSLTRTYRPGDLNRRSFGVGMSSQWDTFLWSANQYQEADLVGPDGSRVHYTRIINPANPTDNAWASAHFITASPGVWNGSHMEYNGDGWNLTRSDGMRLIYGDNAPLQYMQDRFGNRVTLTRNGGKNGTIAQISSPNGRSIRFTYDSYGDVLTATDNIGRTVTYTYDANQRLTTVQDPNGGVTTYTWDTTNNWITSVKDARGTVFLTNAYDSNNRITKQTLANGKSYGFVYTLNANGGVTETDVTDPNNTVRKVTFNSAGYMLTDKQAAGSAVEEGWTYTRDATSNLVTALVDPLGRKTTWTYDSTGHVLTRTVLAGTANAATTTYTYSPAFNQLASVQDPLGHITTLTRDTTLETLTSVTDPLSHATSFTYNAAGQVLTVQDALSHTTTFTYDRGDLATVTDPLSRKSVLYTDAIGRRLTATDPLGSVTKWVHDPINGVKTVTDGLGHGLTTAYTPIGEVASVTDALNHAIGYTYDAMGLLATRTDPMTVAASVTTRDALGHVTAAKDRKGQAVSNTYDALGRLSGSTYADGSTTAWTYDLGDRVAKVVDSLGGTISRTYNGLDEVLTETAPQGTVTYTYDLAGRRATMVAGNQAQVSWGYDNANRLTSITQGSTSVTYGYDAANRRTSATLPGPVSATYTYDNANQVTGISYATGGTTLGTLSYGYDGAGRVTSRGGTLFQSKLPGAVTSATYNAANRLTQRVASGVTVSPSWDANGSLTGDGTSTYGWTARNQLKTIGSAASFVYDGFGRRATATRGGTATSFLYDGWDVAQEQVGGSASANLLLGSGVDERLSRTAGGVTSTYLTDLLGSTVALASGSTPAIATSYGYDAQGVSNVSGTANTNTFQYAGRENDGTGLIAMRNRYYHSVWSRFISEDPIGLAGGSDMYAYVGDAPTTATDSDGLQAVPLVPMIAPYILPFLGAGICYAMGGCGNNPSSGTQSPAAAPGRYPDPCAIGVASCTKSQAGDTANRPPAGSKPIDKTPWSGDHKDIKDGIGAGPKDKTSISPDDDVWGENPDGSWTNHGPAGNFTGSGGPSGQRGKDR